MDSEFERLFEEKFLSQTKNLANGRKIKIFSRTFRDGSFNYSCHLCGTSEIGNEHKLHIHVKSQLHTSLMELDLIPLRSWMESVIIPDESRQKKPCALGCGDCSDLKSLLESMCGFESASKKHSEDETLKSNLANIERSPLRKSRKRHHKVISDNEDTESPDRKKVVKETRNEYSRRSRSRKHSYSRRNDKTSHRSYESSHARSSFQEVYVNRFANQQKKFNDDPIPGITFLSICRYLVTLEQHISKYSSDINVLFTSSLNLERQEIGSSNDLLTNKTLELLANLKHHLKDQIVLGLLPIKMLGVARSFVNEFEQLVEETELKEPPASTDDRKKKLLIDFELTNLKENSSSSSGCSTKL